MTDNIVNEIRVTTTADDIQLRVVEFDKVLERILNHFPEDTRIWDLTAAVRDGLFHLQQAIHGLDIIDFTSSFEDPWIDNLEEEESNKRRSDL